MTEQVRTTSAEHHVSEERHDSISPAATRERSSLVAQSRDVPPAEEKAGFKPGRPFILAFSSICIITLAVALDVTSLSIALPIITERLKGTALQAFWSGTSFGIASAVIQPVIGGFSHAFGRKQLVVVSSMFFAVGSLIAALATNFTIVLAGRTIQGIGGGGILALGEILVTDLVPLSVRGSWLGFLGGIWAIGTVCGPLMGGGFAQSSHSGWRWIFWINLPMIGLGVVTIILFLKIERLKGATLDRVKCFDWLGSFIFIASSVSFLIPVTWGGVMFAWTSWHTLVPLILGASGLLAFGYYERRLSAHVYDSDEELSSESHVQPIIRFSIFGNWTLRLLYLLTLVHGVALWSLLYFLPLYYEGVKGYTPIITGVAVLPETFLTAPVAIVVGIVSSRTGGYRWAIWIGWGITTLGFGLLYLLDPNISIVAFVFLNIPVAIGTGMAFSSMSLGVQAAGRPQDAGHSITFYSFIRVFGQALGVAIGGVIFQNQIQQKLRAYPSLAASAEDYSRDATELVGIIKGMDDGLRKTQLVQAYADALKMIWVVMAALSGAVFISSFVLKRYSLDQEHKTLQGFKESHKESGPEKA